jgi:NADPH:quinone reductase-like Zn-dependent oxidoreductase
MARAYVFTAYGGPEVERFEELPVPDPAPGELLVAVRAAGVNPVDWKRRSGFRPAGQGVAFPAVFGSEASGVVTAVGAGVTGFAVGDAVFGTPATGGYAEYAVLPAGLAARKPPAVSFADAAALPVAAGTAYDALRQLALPAGATVLINGAGGGVGVAAAQLARHAGLDVVGTASAAKRDFLAPLGVRHVEYGPGVADRIAAAAPDGVAGIVDLVGGEALEAVAGTLADRERLVTAADPATAGRLGGAMVVRERSGQVLARLAGLVEQGVLRPLVTGVFPFERAGEALRSVEDGHARGKIVIEVAG